MFYFAVPMEDNLGIGYYVGNDAACLAVFNTQIEADVFVAIMNLALLSEAAEA
jgi:hypothetical protein